jgi:hypothetical protein
MQGCDQMALDPALMLQDPLSPAVLMDSLAEWSKARGDVPLEPDEVHFRNICERCSEIAVELQTQLHGEDARHGSSP